MITGEDDDREREIDTTTCPPVYHWLQSAGLLLAGKLCPILYTSPW